MTPSPVCRCEKPEPHHDKKYAWCVACGLPIQEVKCCEKCRLRTYIAPTSVSDGFESIKCGIPSCPCHQEVKEPVGCCEKCHYPMGEAGGFNSACRNCPCHQEVKEPKERIIKDPSGREWIETPARFEDIAEQMEPKEQEWEELVRVMLGKMMASRTRGEMYQVVREALPFLLAKERQAGRDEAVEYIRPRWLARTDGDVDLKNDVLEAAKKGAQG